MSTTQNPDIPLGERRFEVLCIGSPLMDQLGFATFEDLDLLGLNRGAMTLVDVATTERIVSIVAPSREVSGGTVANTAAGISSFGARAAYLGAVGADVLGERYRADLEGAGVHTMLQVVSDGEKSATGRCVVLVTADAERTMATALGVSILLSHETVTSEVIGAAKLVYFDGYLLDFPDADLLVQQILDLGQRTQTRIAFGLADPFVVDRHHHAVSALVKSGIDLLFCNEHEALALSGGSSFTDALVALRRPGLVAAVTRGPHGAVLLGGDREIEVPAVAVDTVVDVTGAGDQFCAGVLFGYSRGSDLLTCAQLGALAASEVISHLGARPEHSLAEIAAEAGLS